MISIYIVFLSSLLTPAAAFNHCVVSLPVALFVQLLFSAEDKERVICIALM